ncbi:MAG TPA: FUSC family protein, partial [Micromonosporaceae bacterium]|nr:FUSC family protein [Micromonosporaceae bacterium]
GIDQLAGADPGLAQLRLALQAVLGIGAGVGLAYAFVRVTGALQLPPSAGPAAVIQAGDHALLIVAMLISAMVAMMAGSVVTDTTPRAQIVTTLLLPIPMLGAMTIGIALGPYRIASLAWLVVLLAAAVYVRRFGPRGVAVGMVMFNGGFLGFFLHVEIGLHDVGWLAALLGLGVVASLAVRFTLFRTDLLRTLTGMRRSWEGRANHTLVLSAAVLKASDADDRNRASERLRRQLIRLNESTLMIDAQLVESVPDSADIEAQRLFDADLALSNIARFADALAGRCTDRAVRADAVGCVEAVLYGDRQEVERLAANLHRAACDDERVTVVAHRLADSARTYLPARQQLRTAMAERARTTPEHATPSRDDPDHDRLDGDRSGGERTESVGTDGEPVRFTPAVTLNAGWLPGSVPVSTEASTTPGRGGLMDRATLPPYVRASIQVAVAAAIAIVVGDLVSSQRLYWAVLATFLAFMATTNSGEQVRKALFRVAGTAIGIVIGDVAVHLTGGHVWSSLLIVLVSLFFGIYLIRVNYTFMAIGITVTLSQLYAQLGEFSWHLLVLRLVETAIGVGAVIVTVLLVVPLRPQRVLTTGVLLWFRSLSTLINGGLDRMLGGRDHSLRADVRAVDASYAALESVATPLRRATYGRNSAQLAEIRTVSSAARAHARSFAVGVESTKIPRSPRIDAAAAQLRDSIASIDGRIETGRHATYTRSGALLELAARETAADNVLAQRTLRDLTLLDGALARLALALQMTVIDYDTTPESGDDLTLAAAGALASSDPTPDPQRASG